MPFSCTIPVRALPAAGRASPRGTALVVTALIGTTVAPWQLFFQQSNVVDKRITARWRRYERADTVIPRPLHPNQFGGTWDTITGLVSWCRHLALVAAADLRPCDQNWVISA